MKLNFTIPCLFGLEGLVADELKRLDLENVQAENGRVIYSGSETDIAKVNINLRTGERVLLTVGDAKASTFDMLFEGVKAMPWEKFIPKDAQFPVKGHSLNSALHSIPDCQRIIKKAIVERLKIGHQTEALPETKEKYQIQFAILNDVASLYIDTSGTGLHKRGYRPAQSAAPLRETLAAAIVKLSRYRGRDIVIDPFCGSGTIAIEAALAAKNRAPGINREFSAMDWRWLDKKVWSGTKEEAKSKEFSGDYRIYGSDIDPKCVEISQENAKRAGVAGFTKFAAKDATKLELFKSERDNLILTNPPYGERVMEQKEVMTLYSNFGRALRASGDPDAKLYALSSHPEFEQFFGKRAKKKRKLYNGMIKCDLYMYF